jgi:hypothetical protein
MSTLFWGKIKQISTPEKKTISNTIYYNKFLKIKHTHESKVSFIFSSHLSKLLSPNGG